MIKIAVYGKGGIGKSTTVSNLAAVFAENGMTVMQIVCDPKADSTFNLHGGMKKQTVLELIREKGKAVTLEEMVTPGYKGVLCVEAGGPVPGMGCAGRGIIAALETLRGRLGLGGNVCFCGAVENRSLAAFHRASDLFVFSSRSETQGIVLLEAMAAGSPVIAFQAPGAQDVVRDGLNGFLTCEADFAPRVAEVLGNRALRQALSSVAIRTARRFTTDEIARGAEALYCSAGAGDMVRLMPPAPVVRQTV